MTPEQHTTYDRLTAAGWEWWYDGESDGRGVAEVHMRRREQHPQFVRTLATGTINTLGRFVEDLEPRD